MRLNTLKPGEGSKKSGKRLGRGIGSGLGKTSGKGHKGQHARAGGYHKVGFEGGQMPLQRRVPKFGFRSPTAGDVGQVRLSELDKVSGDVIDLNSLKAAKVVDQQATRARIFLSGGVSRAVTVRGVALTRGARAAIESAGGKVEE